MQMILMPIQRPFGQPFLDKLLFFDLLSVKYEASYYLSCLVNNEQDDNKSMLQCELTCEKARYKHQITNKNTIKFTT